MASGDLLSLALLPTSVANTVGRGHTPMPLRANGCHSHTFLRDDVEPACTSAMVMFPDPFIVWVQAGLGRI